MSEILRRCIFRPYRKGMGPTFVLTTWDAGERWDGSQPRNYLAYELAMLESGKRVVLFAGDDIGLPPECCIDSDEAMENVASWLTLKPGDTDSEFFANYTSDQLAFCADHAETLACEVLSRFGEF